MVPITTKTKPRKFIKRKKKAAKINLNKSKLEAVEELSEEEDQDQDQEEVDGAQAAVSEEREPPKIIALDPAVIAIKETIARMQAETLAKQAMKKQ